MMKKKKKKSFDCVEMMHEAALRIYEETKDMTKEEELAYWRQQNEEARRRHPRLRGESEIGTSAGLWHSHTLPTVEKVAKTLTTERYTIPYFDSAINSARVRSKPG